MSVNLESWKMSRDISEDIKNLYYLGVPIEKIAGALTVPESAVRYHLQSALEGEYKERVRPNLDYIREHVDRCTVIQQLAEESIELGNAALKLVRVIDGSNPTPITLNDAEKHLVEEYTDLMLVAEVLGLKVDLDIYETKLERWKKRIS